MMSEQYEGMRRRTNTDLEGEELPPPPEPEPAALPPELEFLDELWLIIMHQPSCLFVMILTSTALAYLGIFAILPDRVCRKYALSCFWGPIACVATIVVCVGWIINPSVGSWLSLPFRLFLAFTSGRGKEKSVLDFSPKRWWQWRKKDLLPT